MTEVRAPGTGRRVRMLASVRTVTVAAICVALSAMTASAAGERSAAFVQQAKLLSPRAAKHAGFGTSVAASGSLLVVGAPFQAVGPNRAQGAVYVFEEARSNWARVAELTVSGGGTYDHLGESVAISGDAIVASAPFQPVGSNRSQGAVFVFVKPKSGWHNATQTAELTASDGAAEDWLGYDPGSLAASDDTIVAGTWRHQIPSLSGSAYVFTKPKSGWRDATDTAELTPRAPVPGARFGESVGVSGRTVVVGAPGNVDQGGSAYVFTRPASGWRNAAATVALTASSDTAHNDLGETVAIAGPTIVASARVHRRIANDDRNAIYVFSEPRTGWAIAHQVAILNETNSREGDDLGDSLAVLGNTILAGDPTHKLNPNFAPGAAYVYRRPSRGWRSAMQNETLKAKDGKDGDLFGFAVAMSGKTVIAAAPHQTMGPGAIYVFGQLPSR